MNCVFCTYLLEKVTCERFPRSPRHGPDRRAREVDRERAAQNRHRTRRVRPVQQVPAAPIVIKVSPQARFLSSRGRP